MLLVFHRFPSQEAVLFLPQIVQGELLDLVESFGLSPLFQVIRVKSMTWMIQNPRHGALCAMRIVFLSWTQGSEV